MNDLTPSYKLYKKFIIPFIFIVLLSDFSTVCPYLSACDTLLLASASDGGAGGGLVVEGCVGRCVEAIVVGCVKAAVAEIRVKHK